jgi:hypothetical protein
VSKGKFREHAASLQLAVQGRTRPENPNKLQIPIAWRLKPRPLLEFEALEFAWLWNLGFSSRALRKCIEASAPNALAFPYANS